jgi:hypothetical protein
MNAQAEQRAILEVQEVNEHLAFKTAHLEEKLKRLQRERISTTHDSDESRELRRRERELLLEERESSWKRRRNLLERKVSFAECLKNAKVKLAIQVVKGRMRGRHSNPFRVRVGV